MKKLILLTTILAGIMHVSYVSIEHWSDFPQLEFAFFVTGGLAQIIWAILFYKKDSTPKYYLGLLINGSLLITWLLTRTVSAPFQEGIEAIGVIDSAIAELELIAIAVSIFWFNKQKVQKSSAMTALVSIVLVLASGIATYATSMGMELIFPDREVSHTHGSEDNHMDDDDHMDEVEHIDDADTHSEEMEEVMEDVSEEEDDHPHDEDDQH